MTADERLALIRIKIERAKEHIDDLKPVVDAFRFSLTQPDVIGSKSDPQTGELTFYIIDLPKAPATLSTISGDALHNLRSSLDHLAHQLVLVAGKKPTLRTSFPIFESATKYKAKSPGKVEGMRKDAIDAIDAIKPYKGGNDTLWLLNKLNNIDKHRLLIAVGYSNYFRSITPSERAAIEKTFAGSHGRNVPFPYPDGTDLFVPFKSPIFPLKTGDELLTIPGSEVEEELKCNFIVAFGEPGVGEGKPLLETLQQMVNLVDNIVLTFRPLLA